MTDKNSIAIIGNRDTILGFKALGVHTFDANTPEEATEILLNLKKENSTHAIIFITEDLSEGITKENWKKLSGTALPAIIPVPDSKGSKGSGIRRIGKMVEQAVGSDIFGEN